MSITEEQSKNDRSAAVRTVKEWLNSMRMITRIERDLRTQGWSDSDIEGIVTEALAEHSCEKEVNEKLGHAVGTVSTEGLRSMATGGAIALISLGIIVGAFQAVAGGDKGPGRLYAVVMGVVMGLVLFARGLNQYFRAR